MRNDNNSIAVWSAKGGSGASTVAALLARSLAHSSPQGAVLVDMCDDAGDILGTTATGETPSTGPVHGAPSGRLFLQDRADALAGVDAEAARPGVAVIVDAGCLWRAGGATAGGRGAGDQPDDLDARCDAVDRAGRSWLVTRSCLLSLRRAALSDRRPDGVVLAERTRPGNRRSRHRSRRQGSDRAHPQRHRQGRDRCRRRTRLGPDPSRRGAGAPNRHASPRRTRSRQDQPRPVTVPVDHPAIT